MRFLIGLIFLTAFLLAVSFSCSDSPEEKREKLSGTWDLVDVQGKSTFERDYKTDLKESARAHQLSFNGDSVKSTELYCYTIDKGSFKINGDSIEFKFSDFSQTNHFEISDSNLILTRKENGRKNKYTYKKSAVEPAPFVWEMIEGSTFPEFNIGDGCFCGYKWVYTGTFETVDNGVLKDTLFELPDTINLAESEGMWEDGKNCFLLDHYHWNYWDGEKKYRLRIYKYDGTFVKLIPCGHWREPDFSNKAFIYKRVR